MFELIIKRLIIFLPMTEKALRLDPLLMAVKRGLFWDLLNSSFSSSFFFLVNNYLLEISILETSLSFTILNFMSKYSKICKACEAFTFL